MVIIWTCRDVWNLKLILGEPIAINDDFSQDKHDYYDRDCKKNERVPFWYGLIGLEIAKDERLIELVKAH